MGQRIEEDTQEKGHRQLIELLNELRVALPGVQVLFAFLLTVPFTQGWAKVTAFQQDLYYATLLCSAVATAFLIAPSAIHRLDFQQGDKPRIVMVSNTLAIIGLTFLALAVVGVVVLITRRAVRGLDRGRFPGRDRCRLHRPLVRHSALPAATKTK